MTRITGFVKDSLGNAFNGKLRVTLDDALVNSNTTPDTLHLPIAAQVDIFDGFIDLNLRSSYTEQVTYFFEVFRVIDTTSYYDSEGNLYGTADSGALVHLHTDGFYYTGEVHSADSQLLTRIPDTAEEVLYSFRAIVPNNDTDFSSLVPTGITKSNLDTGVARLASLVATNPDYMSALHPVVFSVLASAIADSAIANGQASFHVSGSNLQVKIKKADGTIATGTVASLT